MVCRDVEEIQCPAAEKSGEEIMTVLSWLKELFFGKEKPVRDEPVYTRRLKTSEYVPEPPQPKPAGPTTCAHCGKQILGMTCFTGRDGRHYCPDHRLPESRGESGHAIPSGVSVRYSGGRTEWK